MYWGDLRLKKNAYYGEGQRRKTRTKAETRNRVERFDRG